MTTVEVATFAPARFPVVPPPYVPRQFGLFSVASLPDTTGEDHWTNGVAAQPDPHTLAHTYVDYCIQDGELSTPDDRVKNIDPGAEVIVGTPFTVYSGFACAPAGFTNDQREARARAAILNGEERTVERVLFGPVGGTSDNGETVHPNLTDATDLGTVSTSDISQDPAALGDALAALEGAIDADYGGQGVILVPRRVLSAFPAQLLSRSGQKLTTLLGTSVAAISDGDELTPPEGSVTLVGCGAIAIRRGELDVLGDLASSLNRADNRVTRLVERTYAPLIDGTLYSVTVSLSGVPA